jgi:hypothetical protein
MLQAPLAGGPLPRQRWSFVGGTATLHTLEVAEFYGDHVVFVDTRYIVPMPDRLALPILGTPRVHLLHVAGMAWTDADRRDLHQEAGVELDLGLLYVRYVVVPDDLATSDLGRPGLALRPLVLLGALTRRGDRGPGLACPAPGDVPWAVSERTPSRPAVLGVIPARLGSERLPRKPLHILAGRPLIEWVWRRVSAFTVLDRVVVATDSDEVAAACAGFGAETVSPRTATSRARSGSLKSRPGLRSGHSTSWSTSRATSPS